MVQLAQESLHLESLLQLSIDGRREYPAVVKELSSAIEALGVSTHSEVLEVLGLDLSAALLSETLLRLLLCLLQLLSDGLVELGQICLTLEETRLAPDSQRLVGLLLLLIGHPDHHAWQELSHSRHQPLLRGTECLSLTAVPLLLESSEDLIDHVEKVEELAWLLARRHLVSPELDCTLDAYLALTSDLEKGLLGRNDCLLALVEQAKFQLESLQNAHSY